MDKKYHACGLTDRYQNKQCHIISKININGRIKNTNITTGDIH